MSGNLLYVIIGYLLSTNDISKKGRALIYAGAIAGLLMHIIGTFILSTRAGEIVETYKGYNNVPCIMYSVGVFVFFKNVRLKRNGKLTNTVNKLGEYTFGVYLCHYYVRAIIRHAAEDFLGMEYTSLVYRLIGPVVVFSISALLVKIAKRIPVVKHIVP